MHPESTFWQGNGPRINVVFTGYSPNYDPLRQENKQMKYSFGTQFKEQKKNIQKALTFD